MTLIGSKAAKHWFPDFPREGKDTDYAVDTPMAGNKNLEYIVIPPIVVLSEEIATPDTLYTLKASHLFWDVLWEKHVFDLLWLQGKGCRINEPLFWELYNFWISVRGALKRSDLSMSASDFFNNALNTYDHDALHELINPYPTYKKVLKDGAEVDVSEEKFKSLSYEDKLELVREELYVMAYERLAGRHYRAAYAWMLKKFIIHHAPIWEALFIIENLRVLYKPIINYKKLLDNEIKRNPGVIAKTL
jgi:hypothetical protein